MQYSVRFIRTQKSSKKRELKTEFLDTPDADLHIFFNVCKKIFRRVLMGKSALHSTVEASKKSRWKGFFREWVTAIVR